MMSFISVPLVVGIICAGIYGLFELFVRKKERLAIIEKIGDHLDASIFCGKLGLPSYMGTRFSFSALKAGCLLAGIGLGLLVGFFIDLNVSTSFVGADGFSRDVSEVVYGASVLLFGGLGLIIAFVVEMRLDKGKDMRS